MSRWIDADALIERWNNMSVRGRTEFDQEIMVAPSIDIDRPQGEWIEKAISIIDDMQSEGIVDYEQAREFRMRARMKGTGNASTVKVVTHGNCAVCGKPIEGDSLFLCDDCKSSMKGADDEH